MDLDVVRDAFDIQLRHHLQVPGARVDREPFLTRVTSGSWQGVVWTNLDDSNADTIIKAEVARFAGDTWEWKHYSHDRPADLTDRLKRNGLTPGPPETVMIAQVASLTAIPAPAADITLDAAITPAGVAALVNLHDSVFGGNHHRAGQELLHALDEKEPHVLGVLARAAGTVVAAGRIEFHPGTSFASLWGGGTLPQYRQHGIFTALVGTRAALADARGYKYLTVDALPTSQPILTKLGFHNITVTTPYSGA